MISFMDTEFYIILIIVFIIALVSLGDGDNEHQY